MFACSIGARGDKNRFKSNFFSFKGFATKCQFHQCSFARFFCMKVLFGSFSSYILALAPKFRMKNARVNVDEIEGK